MSPAERLAAHIRALPDFEVVEPRDAPYEHMGALIADAALQGGIRFDTVVKPRVQEILAWPEARTTSGFLDVLTRRGPAAVLRWSGARTPAAALGLAELLSREGVETEEELRDWLAHDHAPARLTAIPGIGPKTVDVLRMAVGIPAVAVDVYLWRLLAEAGVEAKGYDAAREVFTGAAELLGIPPRTLDWSVWLRMSRR